MGGWRVQTAAGSRRGAASGGRASCCSTPPLAIPFYLVALALFLLMTLCMVGRLAADRNARVRWFRWNTLKVLLPGLCCVLVLVSCAVPEGTASVPQRRALYASVFGRVLGALHDVRPFGATLCPQSF